MKLSKQKSYPEISVSINTLSHDGRGVTQHEGKTVFVHGALPGEKVLCKVTKHHRRYSEGKVIAIENPSLERVAPRCAHFGICGGCSMQHIDIKHQIQIKEKILLEQLKHFGNVVPQSLLEPTTGNGWGYRGKARLGVKFVTKKGKLLVGFREKLSNYLADIDACPVLHPSVGERLSLINGVITQLTQFDQIPQIEIAVGENATALVIRHLTPLSACDLEKLCQFAKDYHFHLYLQPNAPDKPHKIWPLSSDELLIYTMPDYQIEMKFHPLSFTQVNSEMNRQMIKKTLSLLSPQEEETILDLFCGIGNFTLPIARFAKSVIGIEVNQAMIQSAADNAQHNQISNAQFFSGNLMSPAPSESWMQQTYDKILLDPPRTGAKDIIAFFPNFKAKKVVYVSCNPATLARDAGELVHGQGYDLKTIGLINMFPHTSHIEAVAEFEKR